MANELWIKIGDWEKKVYDDYYYSYNTATTLEEFFQCWLWYESDFDKCSSCDQYRKVDKWIEYKQYRFYELLKEHFEQETNVEEEVIKEWLDELIDQEIFQTCEYDEQNDCYRDEGKFDYLYEAVEEVVALIEENMLNYFVKFKEFTSYILHLIKADIDERRLTDMMCKVNAVRKEKDHSDLIELLQHLISNTSDKIYFKLI